MPTLDSLKNELASKLVYNSRIAAALLDVLAEAGDFGARSRALRVLGGRGSSLQRAGDWIPVENLTGMVRAAGVDRRLARRVGQALMRPGGVLLALCHSGLATIEKAYRRSHHLLARECEGSMYEPGRIEDQHGLIRFHPPEPGCPARLPDDVGAILCGVREGMLEALPLSFGLVPARVRETQCGYAGADHCEFEVSFSRNPRVGLGVGALAGVVAGGALILGTLGLGGPTGPAVLGAAALVLLTAAAGRSADLSRQLEAVAGARRGHLALLDQLDTTLAERMDDLAKFSGTPQARNGAEPIADAEPTGLVPVTRSGDGIVHDGTPGGADPESIAEAGRALRVATTALRDALGENPLPDRAGQGDADDSTLHAQLTRYNQAIERAAARLERLAGCPEPAHGVIDLRELIERIATALRSEWPDLLKLTLDLADDIPSVRCDEHQIEFVIEQLLRNAAEASQEVLEASDEDEGAVIRLALRQTRSGLEVAVEDSGEGIDPEVVDRVFDPFDDHGPVGQHGGMGLPVCFRIVEAHGGELRLQAGAEHGTRVSFVLPLLPSE